MRVLGRVAGCVAGVLGALASFMASPVGALTVSATSDASLLLSGLFGDLSRVAVSDAALLTGVPTGASPTRGAADGGQAGRFADNAGVYGLPATGILLSTGDVRDYAAGPNPGPGNQTRFENRANAAQQDLLAPVTGLSAHFDPIQFDFTLTLPPDVVGAAFTLAFGTEEDPAVFPDVRDGFALMVNGVNVAGALRTGATPGIDTPLPLKTDHPDFRRDVPGTELDRVLAPNGKPALRFDVPLNAGQANRFTLILADGADTRVDSTVFVSGSLISAPIGATEVNPVLPSNAPDIDGFFVLEIPPVVAGQTVWIDPPVSVGFVYQATGGLFSSVTAPSFGLIADPDGYVITVGDKSVALDAGATLDFLTAFGVTPDTFTLDGIDPSLMLDPTDPMLFPTGVAFAMAVSGASVRMTPIIEDYDPLGGGDPPGGGFAPVPLPAGLPLLAGGLFAGWIVSRARRR